MFLQQSQILASLANTLMQDVGSLPTRWNGIATSAQATAYNQIVGALIGRGFTQAQIDAWDLGPEFERDLSLYWCLVRGGVLSQYNGERLDRRRELQGVQVFVAGVWIQPGLPTPGQINSGQIGQGNRFGPPGAFYEPCGDGEW